MTKLKFTLIKLFLNFYDLNLFLSSLCYWSSGLFFREGPHAMLLLYDPQVVLHHRADVFVCVLPAPVQMGPVNSLQMAVAGERKLKSKIK